MPKGKLAWTAFAGIGALLLAAAFGGGFGLSSYLAGSLTVDSIAAIPPNASEREKAQDLQHRYELLKTKLDETAEEAKRIDRLMTLLLTISGFYAIALGLQSYFGLKQTLETAKEDSKEAVARAERSATATTMEARDNAHRMLLTVRAELDQLKADAARETDQAKRVFAEFQSEIREKYPQFADLDANLRDLIGGINAVFRAGEDWAERASGVNARKREELLITEQRLAGVEVFQLEKFPLYRVEILQAWQGFGRYYTARFIADKNRGDWERARIYFHRGINSGTVTGSFWKDYGVHLCQIEVAAETRPKETWSIPEVREMEVLRGQAEHAFRESLVLLPEEPGAIFGLAWLDYLRGSLATAAEQYSAIGTITHWNAGDRKKYLANAFKNSADCRMRAKQDPLLTIADLRRSRQAATEDGILEQWLKDVTEDEDFQAFFAIHPEAGAELLA